MGFIGRKKEVSIQKRAEMQEGLELSDCPTGRTRNWKWCKRKSVEGSEEKSDMIQAMDEGGTCLENNLFCGLFTLIYVPGL